MTLSEFTSFLQTKSVGRTQPPSGEQLTERVYSGMKKIGMDTVPLSWITDTPIAGDVLRRLDANTYVRIPKRPQLNSAEQLDIDEALLDALAYYVMAGLEVQRAKTLMGMYWGEIDAFNTRLIETYMEDATNDSPRYHVYP